MWLASFFHPKAKKWIVGRRIKLSDYSIPETADVAWFHCASLGEFDQGLPVMKTYKNEFPNAFVLVTFFSPSGMEHYHKRDHCVDLAIYLPLDTKIKATAFVKHFKPKQVFFVKYEFWYNHLKCARRGGAKIYGISSLFRPTHRFFKWYGGFFRNALRFFDHFFTQDLRSKELLNSIGIQQVTVSGDTRYDRLMQARNNCPANEQIEQFKGNMDTLFIFGSTWSIDLETYKTAIEQVSKTMKVLIAPHNIGGEHVAEIEQLFPNQTCRYTAGIESEKRILILDTIGQLTSAYQYADIAYIGGGHTGNLHNILEPGSFGVPVIFGPKYSRFPEASLFIQHGVGFSVNTASEFMTDVEHIQASKEQLKAKLLQLFESHQGATQCILTYLKAQG
jgi:3-deoxy-D-manno-octulosonic-acid transferase